MQPSPVTTNSMQSALKREGRQLYLRFLYYSKAENRRKAKYEIEFRSREVVYVRGKLIKKPKCQEWKYTEKRRLKKNCEMEPYIEIDGKLKINKKHKKDKKAKQMKGKIK